jgi:hypothetical protein
MSEVTLYGLFLMSEITLFGRLFLMSEVTLYGRGLTVPQGRGLGREMAGQPLPRHSAERDFFIENLLVQIVMIRWTGLAPWEFECPSSTRASQDEEYRVRSRIRILRRTLR